MAFGYDGPRYGYGTKSAGGPSTQEQLAAILASTTKGVMLLPRGSSPLWATSARSTSVAAGSGLAVGAVDDVSGNDLHALQSGAGNRPVATNGITLDGTDDYLNLSFPTAGPSDCTILVGYKGTDLKGIILSNGGRFALCYEDGNGSPNFSGVGSPTTLVDGVARATRGTLEDAISDDVAHRIELRNADLSPAATWVIGRSLSFADFNVAGAITAFIVIPNDELGASEEADALTLAQALVDQENAGV